MQFRPRLFPVAALLAFALYVLPARSDITLLSSPIPGTPAETAMLLSGANSSVDGSGRRAEPAGWWIYRIVLPPSCRCILRFRAEGEPSVTVTTSDGKPNASRTERMGDLFIVYTTAPQTHPLGAGLRMKFSAGAAPLTIHDLRIEIIMPDANSDGVPEAVEGMMGLPAGKRAQAIPRPSKPQTSFQSGGAYNPGIGLPTDAVLAYSSDETNIRTWLDRGYTVQTMGGFREGAEYVKTHPDEVQKDRSGAPITIGTGSHYMVPTEARNELAKAYYDAALAAGSTGVAPEEPEIWSRAGYSEAFKREWTAKYGTAWEPPHFGVDNRTKAEQLKAFLVRRQIETILNEAQKVKPEATRMVAIHSPVTYYQWGIPVPHASLMAIPALQEVIGQVWAGTARTAARSAGVRAERTFELGFLEYSSLYHLARGTGKRMWFLMDPLEDNPDLPLEDYQRNYVQTLLAALMFPQIDSYEVMPWPQRVYDKVTPGYATVINTVVGSLTEMWRFSDGSVDSGTRGVGTFVADSMGWQRADPFPSDYDGFYGLSMPLVNHGIPVDVLSLDRASEPGYLDRDKALLLSYDFLKPVDAMVNRALADWTRRGGSLILVGGTDPYNDVKEAWWKKAGYATPLDHLFVEMGLRPQPVAPPAPAPPAIPTAVVLTSDPANGGNVARRPFTIDLTPYAASSGSALIRFEDVTPQDGLGPSVALAELRIGGRLAASFRAGSELETRFLAEDHGSRFNGTARFADRDANWTYRFDSLPRNVPVTLTLEIGNGYLVKAGPGGPPNPLIETTDIALDATVRKLRVPPDFPVTLYAPPDGATPLYRFAGAGAPVVWEARVGSGRVAYVGIGPSFLSATAQSSRWMRALVRRQLEKGAIKYEEKQSFVTKRGPYLGVRALGDSYTVEGRYINLLSPTLAVVDDLEVPARGTAFLMEAGAARGGPRLLAASGRVRARSDSSEVTAFMVQAPEKTEGVARLYAGKRRVAGVRAYNMLGEPVAVTPYPDGDTVLLRYANDPDGVIVRAAWQ